MSELQVEQIESGVSFRVKVSAGARTNAFRGIHDGMLKVCVTQVAEKGKANVAVITMLSKALGVGKQVAILSGHSSSTKKISISNVSIAQIYQGLLN